MARKPKPDLDGAIEKYTEAIALDAANPVYWSNRAAAYGARYVLVHHRSRCQPIHMFGEADDTLFPLSRSHQF
jgi:hypothetical protein